MEPLRRRMNAGLRRWLAHYGVAAVASASFVGLSVSMVLEQRADSERLAEQSVRTTARVLAGQIDQELTQIDALLVAAGQRYVDARQGRPGDLERLETQLRREVPLQPLLARVGIVDPDGVNFFNTGFTPEGAKPIDVSTRTYFRRARDGERGLIFDGPVTSRLSQQWSLFLARRIEADGVFAGVVVAVLPVASISERLARAGIGGTTIFNLRDAELRQVARWPEVTGPNAEPGNRNVSQTILDLMQRAPGQDHYVYRTVAPIDGVERLYTYERLASHPLWMTVGRPTSEIALPWHRTALLLGLIALPLIAFSFRTAHRLYAENRHLEQAVAERTHNLAESERFFRSLADTLPSLIGYWGTDLRNRFANAAYREWFGHSPEEMRGMHVADLVGAATFAGEAVHFEAVLRGEPREFEHQVTRPDGRSGTLLVQLTPDGPPGAVRGYFVEGADITSVKAAEARIRQQANEFDTLYNQAPCGYHTLDAEGVVLRMNDTELAWLGRRRDEVIGRHMTEFLSPAGVETFRLHNPRLLAQGSLGEIEVALRRSDGSEFPVLVAARADRDAQGRIVRTHASMTDYTRLRHEQENLRRVLFAAPMAVRVATLKDNRVLFMNEAFCRLVRRDEEAAGRLDIGTAYVDPSAFAAIRASIGRGEAVLNRLVELHLPDMPEVPHVWALGSYMPIVYDGQRCALAWLFDVTELQHARTAAEAANRAKSAFLANMSHEIRTPLNAVLGLNHVLLRDATDALQRDRLGKIDAAARHLLQVISDILDVSKIEAGKLTLESHEFSIDDVIARSVELVRPRADEKGLTLAVEADGLPPRLVGDATRLSQMLLNLLSNAVKFTERGGVTVRARVLGERAGAVELRCEVQDTGPGIAKDAQPRLFDAFEQADSSITRKHGGTGLGLALTRHLAALMGGQVAVESKPGEGSLFWFTVHLANPVNPAPPAQGRSFAELRTLLVGDDGESRESIERLLRTIGVDVDCVASGDAAIAQVEAQAQAGRFYDLLVAEWSLDERACVQTARRIGELLGEGRPPCLLVTPHDDPLMWREAREAQVDTVLLQPVSASALNDALALLLHRSGTKVETPPPGAAERTLREQHAGRRVLLAEDNPINQEVAVELLDAAGIAVDTANDGAEAVAMATANDYALVLMDMQMPRMDGTEATRRIRAVRGRRLPIIAMTANAFAEDLAACLGAGMDDHLTKPVEPDRLYRMLLRWLPARPPVPVQATTREAPGTAANLADRLGRIDGYSLADGLAAMGGRVELLSRVLQTFAARYRDGGDSLREAARTGDAEALAEAAHGIRGACATVGAAAAVEVARALESAARAPAPSEMPLVPLAERLDAELVRISAAVASALDG